MNRSQPSPPALDRAAIAALVPHQGDMCLLDAVVEWDATRIRCTATSHRAPTNPLRAHGRLGAACGVEYAAQAMAVHGGLTAVPDGTPPAAGYLVAVRGVALHAARLDDIDDALDIEAERLSGDATMILYAFTVSASGRPLLSGRASVVLDAARVAPGARA